MIGKHFQFIFHLAHLSRRTKILQCNIGTGVHKIWKFHSTYSFFPLLKALTSRLTKLCSVMLNQNEGRYFLIWNSLSWAYRFNTSFSSLEADNCSLFSIFNDVLGNIGLVSKGNISKDMQWKQIFILFTSQCK